jgi:hypothetical protein
MRNLLSLLGVSMGVLCAGCVETHPAKPNSIAGTPVVAVPVVESMFPRVKPKDDFFYTKLIHPFLEKNGMTLEGTNGIVVIYQPWGYVGAAVRILADGSTITAENGQTSWDHVLTTSMSPPEQWQNIVKQLQAARFFEEPYKDNTIQGTDGYTLYIEASLNGQHQMIARWMPKRPDLCNLAVTVLGKKYVFLKRNATD